MRSKLWLNFLHTKNTAYIKSLGIPKAAALYDYTNEDFGPQSIVTETDFQFAEKLVDDDYV